MRARDPIAVFWIAVLVTVFALGIAWPAWKAAHAAPLALLIAVPASLVCAAAAIVAGRVLIVISRGARVTGRQR